MSLLSRLRGLLHDLKDRIEEDLHAKLETIADKIHQEDEEVAVGEAVTIVLDAYQEAGYTHVRLETAGDDQVCGPCQERQGRAYVIAEAPRALAAACENEQCRCFYVPVIG